MTTEPMRKMKGETPTVCQRLFMCESESHSVMFDSLQLSQFLGRLIRSPGSPRRREGSGILKEEERTNTFISPLHSLVLVI